MADLISYESIQSRHAQRRQVLEKNKMRRDWLMEQRQLKAADLVVALERIGLLDKVALLLREASNYARETGRQLLESMGSNIMKHIFGPKFGLKIELIEEKNKPTKAEIYVLTTEGGVVHQTRPQDANGGAFVDGVSTGLRIAMVETQNPKTPGHTLIIDEPGKHVSDEFVPAFSGFIGGMSVHFKRQVIMVTHDHHLAESAETVYRIVMGASDKSEAIRER